MRTGGPGVQHLLICQRGGFSLTGAIGAARLHKAAFPAACGTPCGALADSFLSPSIVLPFISLFLSYLCPPT